MMHSIVQTYIERLKKHFGVTSDDDLARKLEIGKSTIATWRRRGAVPRDFWGEKLVYEVDYFPVIYGHLASELAISELGQRILINGAMHLALELNASEVADWANWIADNKYSIFYRIVQKLTADQDEMRIDDTYVGNTLVSFAIKIASKNMLTPSIIMQVRSDMNDC
ncbi:bacteriophage CI repressor-like protein [Agrobacterium vitis]|nr:bacteriophage CI repressor-like protein [Agrobacterium vitis]